MNQQKLISAIEDMRLLGKEPGVIRMSTLTEMFIRAECEPPKLGTMISYRGIRIEIDDNVIPNAVEFYDRQNLTAVFATIGPLWNLEEYDERKKALPVGSGGKAGSQPSGAAAGTQSGKEAGGGR